MTDVSESASTLVEGTPAPQRPAGASPTLFRVIWRWHFYAGVLVAPVLFTLAVTGATYLFGAEIHDAWNRALLFVSPGPALVPLAEQVRIASEARPDLPVQGLEISSEPDRSTIVTFRVEGERPAPRVFIDPYRGQILGTADHDPVARFFDIVLVIHRELFVGTPGRLVTELVTSWSAILMITGLCLWWPRSKGKVRGVWLPRWPAKPYTLLRDVHALSGAYLLPVLLLIAGTGLFYTIVWGESFHIATRPLFPAKAAAAQPEEPESPATPGKKPADVVPPRVSVDEVVQIAASRFPGRNLSITLPDKPGGGYFVAALNDYARGTYGPMTSTTFQVHRDTGEVTAINDLSQSDRYWWHCWTYPLHVGTIFGPATKIVWLAACFVLAGLPATGLWMWWIRRPPGRSGFPRKPELRLPLWLCGVIGLLCVLLPSFGMSVVLILFLERTTAFVRRANGAGGASA